MRLTLGPFCGCFAATIGEAYLITSPTSGRRHQPLLRRSSVSALMRSLTHGLTGLGAILFGSISLPSGFRFSWTSIAGSLDPPCGGGPNKCLNSHTSFFTARPMSVFASTMVGRSMPAGGSSGHRSSISFVVSAVSSSYDSKPKATASNPVLRSVGHPIIRSDVRSSMISASVANVTGRGILNCVPSVGFRLRFAARSSRNSPSGTTSVLFANWIRPPLKPQPQPMLKSLVASLLLTQSASEPVSRQTSMIVSSPSGVIAVSAQRQVSPLSITSCSCFVSSSASAAVFARPLSVSNRGCSLVRMTCARSAAYQESLHHCKMSNFDYFAKYAKNSIFQFFRIKRLFGYVVILVKFLRPQNFSKSQKPQNYRELRTEDGSSRHAMRTMPSMRSHGLLDVV